MKFLQEKDTIPIPSSSMSYSIGDNTFTHYLQVCSCQISVLVCIISFFLMKFKYKIGSNHILSYHSIFLLLYSILLMNTCICHVIESIYINWIILCLMYYTFVRQFHSLIRGNGIYVSEIRFTSKIIYLYLIGFIVATFPYPLPFDLSSLQIGVLMLINGFFYFHLDNHLKHLVLYLSENPNNEELKFTICIVNMQQNDLINVYFMLKSLLFSMFVICVLITTLFETLVFIQLNLSLYRYIKTGIEVLQVVLVYWYYFVMVKISYLLYKEHEQLELCNEGIELSQSNSQNKNVNEEDNEDEEEDDNEEYYNTE